MLLSIGFVILFAICGVSVSEVVFRDHKFINRIWLGLSIGLLMLTWLPSLFSLFIGFTSSAQLLAAVAAFFAGTASFAYTLLAKKHRKNRYCFSRNDWISILCLLPITLIFVVLLHTHILYRPDNRCDNICTWLHPRSRRHSHDRHIPSWTHLHRTRRETFWRRWTPCR